MTARILAFPKPKRVLCELPLDFQISEGNREWFRRSFGSVSNAAVMSQHEQFKDTALRDGKQYKDWDAAWRTWMRNWQTDFGRRVPGSGKTPADPTTGPRTFRAQAEEEALAKLNRRNQRLATLARRAGVAGTGTPERPRAIAAPPAGPEADDGT